MTISKVIRGIRDTIPAGYILGRAPGIASGKAQLISPSDLADKIIATGKVYSPANPQPVQAAGGLFSQVLSAVPTQTNTGFTTWLNQNGASVVNGATGLSIVGPYNANAYDISALGQAAPSTPYGVMGLFCVNPYGAGGSNNGNGFAEFGFSDGTKAIGFQFTTNSASVFVQEFSKFQGATPTNVKNVERVEQFRWLGLSDDGTNIYFYTSSDGVNWSLFYQQTRTAYLSSPSHIFFSYDGYSAQGTSTLLSWATQNSILG